MVYVIILIVLLCTTAVVLHIKDTVSKFCIMSFILYWGCSLVASCFNPFGMSSNCNETYCLLIAGMISFVFGFIIFETRSIVKQRFINISRLKNQTLVITKNKILNCLYILCSLFASKFAATALIVSELNKGTLSGEDRGEILFEGSYLNKFFYHFVMNPLYYITISVLCVVIFTKVKNRKLFCLFSIVFLIASIILSGGRGKFVIIVMYFLFMYICLTKDIKKKILNVKTILTSVVVLGIMMVFMSLQTGFRSTGTYSLNSDNIVEAAGSMGETFGIYSVIPIRLFDYAITNDYFDKFEGPKYGRAVFAGFDGIATGVIRRFSGIEPESTLGIADYLQENEIYIIPGNHPYNYCYTALFFCYMDFGFAGVIILPFLFGLIFRYYIFQFYKTSSLPSFILIGFGYFMMMHSLFQDYFIKNWTMVFCLGMALIQYIFYTKNIRLHICANSDNAQRGIQRE